MEMTTLAWSKLGEHFTDEDKAREYMEFLRWGNAGPACPHCGGSDPYRLTPKAGSKTRQGVLKCRECRKQFTVTVGTVFEDSHVKLTKWIQAIYLIGASKKGISAHQLHRMLGVTYRSAWFMAHRLRYAMSAEPMAAKLAGTVEVDEGYIGGKRKGGRTASKTIGSVEGYLEAISIHSGKRFVVYDSLTKKAVNCNFHSDEMLDSVKDYLGKRVLAHGLVHWNAKSEAKRVEVEGLRVIGAGVLPTTRELSGAYPNITDGMSTEEYIRSIRGDYTNGGQARED